MKHRVYMRDWFFNAGIIGFLQIVSDGKDYAKGVLALLFARRVGVDFNSKQSAKAELGNT